MMLLKANVPYEIIMKWDWKTRAAALVVAGTMDGGEFSWESLCWRE